MENELQIFLDTTLASARSPGKKRSRWGRSHRIWQVSQSLTILVTGGMSPKFERPIYQLVGFHPQKTGGFWEGQFSAVPKFYGTRPPPLIQSCYNIDIESSRYSGGDNKKQLVKISDIVLKHWLKNFDDSSSSKINSDKNPSTEITKPLSACNGWFQINRREIIFGLGFSWLGFGFQSLRAKVSSACAFT